MNQLYKKIRRRFLSYTGLYNILWYFLPNGVYVFNYHRIGKKEDSIYDRTIFSCDAAVFEQQIKTIKKRFTVISCEQLADILDKNHSNLNKKYAVITFDDGYLDNYTEAFPVLKKHRVSATFFLPYNFINSKTLPWWDKMANVLRQNKGKLVPFIGNNGELFLDPNNLERCIHQYIHKTKRLADFSAENVLVFLQQKYSSDFSSYEMDNKEVFINWEQAKDMLSQGMEIGSHTINHPVLSELNELQQQTEIFESKRLLEEKLGKQIIAIAYPTGRKNCYNNISVKLTQDAGYRLAFSNEPGINLSKNLMRFELTRFSINHDNVKSILIY